MSPTSPPRNAKRKWRKRKRGGSNLGKRKQQKPHDDDDDDEEEEEEDEAAPAAAAVEDGDDDPAPEARAVDPVLDLRESEVLSESGVQICDFPVAVRRAVNRPHPSVLAIVSAERAVTSGVAQTSATWTMPLIENISYGQLQALSYVLPDNPSLPQPYVTDAAADKCPAYMCTPPPLMEGCGVSKCLPDGQLFLVPMHSDWFSATGVHRLERQVVPHFFSGKSTDHTPEKYIMLRNKIIAKYLENPGRRLLFAECQTLVSGAVASELYDLSRIIRFLDNWGIINYFASSSVHPRLRFAGSLLREDTNGELMVQTTPLKSIDSLILFDRPKCSIRLEDVRLLSSSSSSSSASPELDAGLDDLDTKIRERLSEYTCSYCSRPLPLTHYQSQKEADVVLCTDCFHNARFITGHSSLDFLRVDSKKDTLEVDGDNWTDQETLLLLEAMEKYNDNWNEIAEHVGTKSKAQCILHFIRLPMEDGFLENIEIPPSNMSSSIPNGHGHERITSNSNGNAAGAFFHDLSSENPLPFANSANPVMSLVAFLASAIGPRIAAACASTCLQILTTEDPRSCSDKPHRADGSHQVNSNLSNKKDEASEDRKDKKSPLDPELVKYAAKCGLSAAAMKSKLFADQEEREIQRMAATIISNQLKRLELKLKQFAEVETLLMKECEQIERTRQRISAERVHMMTGRFNSSGNSHPTTVPVAAAPAAGAASPVMASANTRLPTMSASVAQPNIQQMFGTNLAGHPQMQFMQRQQPMVPLGPRLPLSAIHPSQSPSPATPNNMMFNPSVANTSIANHHPSLRPSTGNKILLFLVQIWWNRNLNL